MFLFYSTLGTVNLVSCFVLFSFEAGPHYVAWAGLVQEILLSPLECWDYRHVPPCPALSLVSDVESMLHLFPALLCTCLSAAEVEEAPKTTDTSLSREEETFMSIPFILNVFSGTNVETKIQRVEINNNNNNHNKNPQWEEKENSQRNETDGKITVAMAGKSDDLTVGSEDGFRP
jgi:hypothetical protein